MVAFPTRGETDNNPITLEIHIKKLSTRCIGERPKGVNFCWRMGGRKVQNATKTIDKILKSFIHPEDSERADYLLKVLGSNVFCHHHRGKLSVEKVVRSVEVKAHRNSLPI
jgi:hypothetical protein